MMLDFHPILDAALKLGLAFILALPVGWVRERPRSVSLRSYPLLSVCVCAFLMIAKAAAWEPGDQSDAFYGVLTGIGFVGAGAIVKSPEQARGMSSAVGLWIAGAIGLGAAYDTPLIAATLSLACVLTLRVPRFKSISRWSRGVEHD